MFKNSFEKIPGDRGKYENPKCPNCNGAGTIINSKKEKEKCSKCNGSGIIEDKYR